MNFLLKVMFGTLAFRFTNYLVDSYLKAKDDYKEFKKSQENKTEPTEVIMEETKVAEAAV